MAGASGESLLSFRVAYPDVLQRGRANAVKLECYRDGSGYAGFTAATCTLYDPTGEVVSTGAASVSSGVATYTIAALDLPATATLGEGYQLVWVCTIDGVQRTVDREAAVAVRPISPSVAEPDLQALYPDLAQLRGPTLASLQGFIDEAWKQIVVRWISEGGLTYQVKSAYAFRAAHQHLALALFFRYAAKGQPARGNFLELADTHQNRFEAEWQRVSVTLDRDGDGRVDNPGTRSSSSAVLSVNAPPDYVYGRGRSRGV